MEIIYVVARIKLCGSSGIKNNATISNGLNKKILTSSGACLILLMNFLISSSP
jgi:hypothetical protein